MKEIRCLLLASALVFGCSGCALRASEPVQSEFYAMDTVMRLSAYGNGAKAAVTSSQAKINDLETLLSRTREESAVSQINDQAGAPVQIEQAPLWHLLCAAETYAAATNGSFDITIAPVVSAWGFTTDTNRVPSQSELDALLAKVDYSRITLTANAEESGGSVTLAPGQSIDLGGIAKGYASDCVAALYAQNGVTSGSVYLGGNVYVCGKKPDGSVWRVGVQDPADPESLVGVLSLSDAFAVTSGGYQRNFTQKGVTYHHILDPATGYPAESGLTSVTVVASAGADLSQADAAGSGTMCDAFSTALFVMGTEKALDFWRSGDFDFDLVMVTADHRVLITDGIADCFETQEGSGYTYEIVS